MKLINIDTPDADAKVSEVKRLLSQSFQPLHPRLLADQAKNLPHRTQMHSHHCLDMIFHVLWKQNLLERESPGCKIFRTILFHQSLVGTANSNTYDIVALSKQELVKFFDEPIFKYIRIL